VIVDFRYALGIALKEMSPPQVAEMCKLLDIERVDVSSFMNGTCALTHAELQQVLTFVGYRLER
jgi:hypothetical protein